MPALLMVLCATRRHDDAILLHHERGGSDQRLDNGVETRHAQNVEEDLVLLQQRA